MSAGRARDLALLAGAVVIITAWLVWWSPTVVLRLARLGACRARFLAEMVAVDVLFMLRRDRAARRLLAAVILRNRQLVRAAKERVRERRRRD